MKRKLAKVKAVIDRLVALFEQQTQKPHPNVVKVRRVRRSVKLVR
jgi:hypothetical protein